MHSSTFISGKDILNSAIFASLLPVAWLAPEAMWWSIAQFLADAHIRLKGSRAALLNETDLESRIGTAPEKLERDFLTGMYVEIFQMLREQWGGHHRPSIRLVGGDILNKARDEGRGAILWTTFSNFGGLMVKKALAEHGLPLVTLRSYSHPYSASRFGLRFLNTIRTRIEDRHIKRAVTLYPDRDIVALRELMQCLTEKSFVEITANSGSGNPLKTSFMGGTLQLALGAPTLARLCSVPLIPVFTRITEDKGFEVLIEPPLEIAESPSDQTAEEHLAGRYTAFLEKHLLMCPTLWRGWFSETFWSADKLE